MSDGAASRRGIIVTGATGVLGHAMVELLAREGAFLGLHYRSRDARAQDLAARARALGAQCVLLQADLGEPGGGGRVVDRFLQEHSTLDVLVNNAGGSRDGLLYYMSRGEWDAVLQANLDTPFEITQAAVKHMIPRKSGRIINVASASGLLGLAGQTHYAAAKAGVLGFTRALAREVGRFGILVNAVAPGAIESPSVDAVPDKHRQWLEDASCLRRLGKPEEVACVVRFLASPDASYITGQTLSVDGGITG